MEPTRLGPYAIRGRIGRGGMGAVYEAVDETTGEAVAVKTLSAHLGDDPGLRRRFATEIETLKALRHPGIVRLLAFGEEDGQPYFAMELVRGRSLEQLLRAGRQFTWQETVATALEVTRALKTAHDHGVVHRDIKPANLLFADEPVDGAAVKIADFGIARLFGDAGHTMVGTVVGTAEYMAPEQAAGKPADHRADLYALGLVMFAMLAGRPPFRGGPAPEVIERQRHEPPPRIATLVPAVPAALDELVDRMLSKDPARRPASALALGRLLAAVETVQEPEAPAAARGGLPPAATAQVDLQAETIDVPAKPTSASLARRATRREVAAGAGTLPAPEHASVGPAARVTTPDEGSGGPAAQRTRHTRVPDLDREEDERAARRARRERLRNVVSAVVILVALAAMGWWAVQPESADGLYSRIKAIEAQARDEDEPRGSEPRAAVVDAKPLAERFLQHHGSDPRADEIERLLFGIEVEQLWRRVRLRMRLGREPEGALERDFRAAMDREPASPTACLDGLKAFLSMHAATAAGPDGEPWLALARREIERVTPKADRERTEDLNKIKEKIGEANALARQAATAPDAARRARLLTKRRELLDGVIEIYGPKPHAARAVAQVRTMLGATPNP